MTEDQAGKVAVSRAFVFRGALARLRDTGHLSGVPESHLQRSNAWPEQTLRELVERGELSEDDVALALSEQLDWELVFPCTQTLDWDSFDRFPIDQLVALRAVPLLRHGREVVMAFDGPHSPAELASFQAGAGVEVRPAITTTSCIDGILAVARERVTSPSRPGAVTQKAHCPQCDTLLHRSLQAAHEAGASELRFDPGSGELFIGHRISDRLVCVGSAPLDGLQTLHQQLKAHFSVGIGEEPALVHAEIDGVPLQLQVRLIPGDPRGDSIELRLVSGSVEEVDLGPTRERLVEATAREAGIVLVSAPTPERSRGLARAVLGLVDSGQRLTASVDLGPGAEPDRQRRYTSLPQALAARPDVLGLGPLATSSVAELGPFAAGHLLVLASCDPSPGATIFGWLERSGRPSLLATCLLLGLAEGAPADGPFLFDLTQEQRRWLAADARVELIRSWADQEEGWRWI